MLELLIYFFIGISLSIDAFSVAISIGTTSPTTKQIVTLSTIVGIFHFIMPFIGITIGQLLLDKIMINVNYIIFSIFILLAVGIILEKENESNITKISFIKCIIIAFVVSIDSLSVGIALGLSQASFYKAGMIFSIISSISTLIGLVLGKKTRAKYKEKAKYIGILMLIIVALKYLIYG